MFVVIGVAAVVLRVDRLVDYGFASLPSADPAAFRVLCAAFVLIAVLGLAITAAERALIEESNAALAGFGATLAYLGHCGTIAFFSWWLLRSIHGGATTVDLNVRWKATDKLELFGGVQNLFDRIAPLDPLTYGATSYNPLDYSGAIGRYFNAGVKYKF